MSGDAVLDGAIFAISLFNTILMIWLGLTVLLNAERQSWGVWVAGGSLLLGGVFFLIHSAIFGFGVNLIGPEFNLLWQIGWVLVLLLPLSWYLVTLWYNGYFENRDSEIRHRDRPWLYLILILLLILTGLLVVANPLQTLPQTGSLNPDLNPRIIGLPLVVAVYLIYIGLCMGLSWGALRYPGPTRRVMGELARRRARPWLSAAAVVLLLVSFLVGAAMVWILARTRSGVLLVQLAIGLAWFDLVIAGLIALAVVLLGQGIVSYEVFTGRTLPRRGFARQWRRAVILAAGYGILVGGSLAAPIRPVYSVLLGTVLMTLFFALLSWRSYADRERYMRDLRPFVLSQNLYANLIEGTDTPPLGVDLERPFRALCRDVLGARQAYLAAMGPLAALTGSPLGYPEIISSDAFPLRDILHRAPSPEVLFLSVQPERYGNAHWAIPLWGEGGLIGVFLLGEKADGSLYTQEEFEIARASGERLVDARAGGAMAQRLMVLQRQQVARGQVVDQQTRRVLHDEVLPQLHSAILELQAGDQEGGRGFEQAVSTLAGAHRRLADLLRELPDASAPEVRKLGLVGALRRAVEMEYRGVFEKITWQIDPDVETRLAAHPATTLDVLYYAAREAVRNAARYGRGLEGGDPVTLDISLDYEGSVVLAIEDTGVGFAAHRLGDEREGQGLALHGTMMAVVGGSLLVESEPGRGTRVRLVLPA